MRRILAGAVMVPGVLIAIPAAIAAEPKLEEVIVTAGALRKSPLEIAQPTAILVGDELRRQIATSIGETLTQELGVTSSYFGPTASRPVIRGLGGFRVQVLDDGISSLDVSSLSADHAVSIEAVVSEQIEIIKGPAALLYGSGAAGGLVNIVSSRIPGERMETPVSAAVELRGDTAMDERTVAASLDGGTGAFGLHLDYFDRETDNVQIPGFVQSRALREQIIEDGGIPSDARDEVENTASDTKGGAVGGSYVADQGMAGLSVSRYETVYGIPGEEEAFIDMTQDRYDVKAEWTPDGTVVDAIRFRGGFNDYTHTEFEAPGEPGTIFNQEAYEIRLAVDHHIGADWNGTVGVQLLDIDFEAIGDEAFVPQSTTQAFSLFGFEERNFGAWTLELGARAEKQEVTPDSATALPKFDETAISVSAGTVWKFAPDHALTLNVTRTERNPQAVELYADGPHIAAQRFEVGDPGLDKESAITADLSLRGAGRRLEWVVSAFYNDYTDYIFPNPTGDIADDLPVFAYVQGDAKFHGFEAELTIPLFEDEGSHLDLRLASDYVRGELDNGGDLPQIPPLRFGAGLHYERDRWHAGAQAFYYDEQDRIAANELPTDSFTMVDLDLSYRMPLARGDIFMFLRGTNLLDEEARQHASTLKDIVPMPGRSAHLGVRVEF
jgi:iron complex outermembrane receptor protein